MMGSCKKHGTCWNYECQACSMVLQSRLKDSEEAMTTERALADKMGEVLCALIQFNHHGIDEEMWRIVPVVEAWRKAKAGRKDDNRKV